MAIIIEQMALLFSFAMDHFVIFNMVRIIEQMALQYTVARKHHMHVGISFNQILLILQNKDLQDKGIFHYHTAKLPPHDPSITHSMIGLCQYYPQHKLTMAGSLDTMIPH
jgi:hypothetical protein